MKTGTLKELNVQAGDVVQMRDGLKLTYTIDRVHNGNYYGDKTSEKLAWNGYTEGWVLISRATPDLPHGHVTLSDGRRVDLTKNRVRCDLMDPEELQVMKDHGGPYEKWGLGEWSHCSDPMWITAMTYRVAPKPVVETEPREWLISMDTMHVQSVPSGFKPDGSATRYVHVREVIIDTKTEEL